MLLGTFLCLHLGATPEEAGQPFRGLQQELCPYRDATWVKSTHDLHVRNVWAGLVRAAKTGLYIPASFNKHEVRRFSCCPFPCVSVTIHSPISHRRKTAGIAF